MINYVRIVCLCAHCTALYSQSWAHSLYSDVLGRIVVCLRCVIWFMVGGVYVAFVRGLFVVCVCVCGCVCVCVCVSGCGCVWVCGGERGCVGVCGCVDDLVCLRVCVV